MCSSDLGVLNQPGKAGGLGAQGHERSEKEYEFVGHVDQVSPSWQRPGTSGRIAPDQPDSVKYSGQDGSVTGK